MLSFDENQAGVLRKAKTHEDMRRSFSPVHGRVIFSLTVDLARENPLETELAGARPVLRASLVPAPAVSLGGGTAVVFTGWCEGPGGIVQRHFSGQFNQ